MIQCPYCERSLSSNGSYRVHKHRFHKGMEYREPVVVHEDEDQPIKEPEPNEIEDDIFSEDIYTPLKASNDGNENFDKNFILDKALEPQQWENEQKELEQYGRTELERGNDGKGLAIIGGLGAIAVVIILAMLEKRR